VINFKWSLVTPVPLWPQTGKSAIIYGCGFLVRETILNFMKLRFRFLQKNRQIFISFIMKKTYIYGKDAALEESISKIQRFQVCYDLNINNKNREIKELTEAMKNFKIY
jgi:hypothetical protein